MVMCIFNYGNLIYLNIFTEESISSLAMGDVLQYMYDSVNEFEVLLVVSLNLLPRSFQGRCVIYNLLTVHYYLACRTAMQDLLLCWLFFYDACTKMFLIFEFFLSCAPLYLLGPASISLQVPLLCSSESSLQVPLLCNPVPLLFFRCPIMSCFCYWKCCQCLNHEQPISIGFSVEFYL